MPNKWDKIAKEWDRMRQKPVEFAIKLASTWKPGKILDIGTGNARNLKPFLEKCFDCTGIDSSKELIKIAKQRTPDAKLLYASAVKLPFPDKSFDYVICLAVLHHLKPKDHEKALKEIQRVLKPGGKAGIAVWNKLQSRFIFGKKEQVVPWKLPNKIIGRYYYFFTCWELRKLLKKQGFIIKKGNILGKNIEFIVQKP
ncbi:MAG: class I SAM-dependent methyltransferase [Candidatus Woesearchaeota archaeon]